MMQRLMMGRLIFCRLRSPGPRSNDISRRAFCDDAAANNNDSDGSDCPDDLHPTERLTAAYSASETRYWQRKAKQTHANVSAPASAPNWKPNPRAEKEANEKFQPKRATAASQLKINQFGRVNGNFVSEICDSRRNRTLDLYTFTSLAV